MKRTSIIVASIAVTIALVLGIFALIYLGGTTRGDDLYQVSSLQALFDGKMAGVCTIGDLLDHGDTGIGTFDSLDGEMVVLGGFCYQVTSDGVVHLAPDTLTTPFATVAFFTQDATVEIMTQANYSMVKSTLDSELPNPHSFYLIKMHALFPELTLRSVPPAQHPYPSLAQVIANQTVFTYSNLSGTMVGLYSPVQAGSLSSPGFHFHFISDDGSKGGHVLDFESPALTVGLDLKGNITVEMLPY